MKNLEMCKFGNVEILKNEISKLPDFQISNYL